MHSRSPELTQFAEDVLSGLSSSPKHSRRNTSTTTKARGCSGDNEAARVLPDRAEMKIFPSRRRRSFKAFANGDNAFDLIELGAGDGTKTAVLVDISRDGRRFPITQPIDISQEALDASFRQLYEKFPTLQIEIRTRRLLQDPRIAKERQRPPKGHSVSRLEHR